MKLLFVLCMPFLLIGCEAREKGLLGAWSNGQGQTLIFHSDNTALWLFESAAGTDTFHIQYTTNFNAQPATLDLSGFEAGPLQDQTLYGIVELGSDSFRCDFEAGNDPGVRPTDFDPRQTQMYSRLKP